MRTAAAPACIHWQLPLASPTSQDTRSLWEKAKGASWGCMCPSLLPPSLLMLLLPRVESFPRGSSGAFTFVFNGGYNCAVQQHMNAKRAWKFKHKLLRYACHKSKPYQYPQCVAHGASLGIPAAATCPTLQPATAPKSSFCPFRAGVDAPPWPCSCSQTRPLTLTHFILSQQCK